MTDEVARRLPKTEKILAVELRGKLKASPQRQELMAQGILSRNPFADVHSRVFVTIPDARTGPSLLWWALPPAQIDLAHQAVFQ